MSESLELWVWLEHATHSIMTIDNQNYEKMIQSYLEFFGSDKIHIEKFVRENLVYNGHSYQSMIKYLNILKMIRVKFLNKPFDEWTKEDTKDVVAKINISNYSDWSKYSFKLTLRKFFQIFSGYEWDSHEFPEIVKWIKLRRKNDKIYEILTKLDVEKLIENATNLRDKSLIGLLWSSGCRISELSNLKLKDIQWDENGLSINVCGKTGQRTVRIGEYWNLLREYLAKRKYDSEWVWVCLDNCSGGHRMSKRSIRKMLRKIGKRANIGKPLNPHNFRHSICTEYSKFMTDSEMKLQFGWSQNSRMCGLYSHLSARDVSQKIVDHFNNHNHKTNIEPRQEDEFIGG